MIKPVHHDYNASAQNNVGFFFYIQMFNYENHFAACFTHISGDDRNLSTETPEAFSKPLPGVEMQTFSIFR